MRCLGPTKERALEEREKGLRGKLSRVSTVSALFEGEEATPEVLAFLQKTQAGR